MNKRIFILKIQGTKKIPDYIQIRDEDFTLIAYFKVNNPKTALSQCHLLDNKDDIQQLIKELPYGKMMALNIT